VNERIKSIGLDPLKFGKHSLRRTKAPLVYRKTGYLRATYRVRRPWLHLRSPNAASKY